MLREWIAALQVVRHANLDLPAELAADGCLCETGVSAEHEATPQETMERC